MRAERLTLHRRARLVEGTCATREQSGRSAISASPAALDDTELRTKAWWAMVVKSARESGAGWRACLIHIREAVTREGAVARAQVWKCMAAWQCRHSAWRRRTFERASARQCTKISRSHLDEPFIPAELRGTHSAPN